MRPCQQCNAPVPARSNTCPVCGAEQQITVGFQKGAVDGSVNAPTGEEPSRPAIVERLEQFDFNPNKGAWLCLLGLLIVCGAVAVWSPQGAAILLGICTVIALFLMLILN